MQKENDNGKKNYLGMTLYVTGWAVVAIVVAGAVLWGMTVAIERIELPQYHPSQGVSETPAVETIEAAKSTPDMSSELPAELQAERPRSGPTTGDASRRRGLRSNTQNTSRRDCA